MRTTSLSWAESIGRAVRDNRRQPTAWQPTASPPLGAHMWPRRQGLQIAGGLGFSAVGLTWVIYAYTLTFGGLLLLGGKVADR